ncbi:hypothetical protein ACFQY4_28260 [Catellatospora bangladeshensis]
MERTISPPKRISLSQSYFAIDSTEASRPSVGLVSRYGHSSDITR